MQREAQELYVDQGDARSTGRPSGEGSEARGANQSEQAQAGPGLVQALVHVTQCMNPSVEAGAMLKVDLARRALTLEKNIDGRTISDVA